MYHSPIQLDVFPTDVQMRRIDPARNMRRFYRLSIQPDLFGGASLVREWGRIGARGSSARPSENGFVIVVSVSWTAPSQFLPDLRLRA